MVMDNSQQERTSRQPYISYMNASNWKLDLFTALDRASSLSGIMDASLQAIRPYGFDFCAWRIQQPYDRHVSITSTEDEAHRQEVARAYDNSPCSRHCSRSSVPFSWLGSTCDDAFKLAPSLFEEYYACGHRAGWAQSVLRNDGAPQYSMFYAESVDALTSQEMAVADQHMQWVSAATLVRVNELHMDAAVILSDEQCRVLEWLSDDSIGAEYVANKLNCSVCHVQRLVKQALTALDCRDLHMGIARATLLGLLFQT